MEQLVEVVQELSLARDLEAVMTIVRRAARELTGADGAAFVLRDNDQCFYAEENAVSPLWKGQRFPMSQCISGWVMRNRQPAIIEDVYADPRIPAEAYRPTFVRSLTMVPIRTRDPIGAIGNYWNQPYHPTPQQIKILQALADTTAVALENIRIYSELEQQVRERTAELEQAKKEAEQANACKSRFLAAASHDLRQPLQSVGLYLSALSRQLDQPEQQAICNKARKPLNTMGELLDTLLDITKLESGSITPKKQDFPIQDLLERIIEANLPQAEEKGIQLACMGANATVHSDPALLERVIDNLVTNAIRYTPQGQVTLACVSGTDTLRITVADTGIGIPEEALEAIFEEYHQLNNPGQDRNKGLGLGLSIVKHIAHTLDHQLDVSSVPGEGSTFGIEIPLGKPLEQPATPCPRATAPKRGDWHPSVLLVDDDPAIVDAMSMLLQTAGVQVHAASNGDEALALIQSGIRTGLVVSDYRLPGHTGIETIRRLRDATAGDLPAVLLTGDTLVQETEATKLPNCKVLCKPINTDQLISLIESFAA